MCELGYESNRNRINSKRSLLGARREVGRPNFWTWCNFIKPHATAPGLQLPMRSIDQRAGPGWYCRRRMTSISSSLIRKPVKNWRNYQEDLRFMRQLNKSHWPGAGFPWPLILLGLVGETGSWVAGLPLEKVGRGQFRAGHRRYSAVDCVLFSILLAGEAEDLRQQSAVANTSQ